MADSKRRALIENHHRYIDVHTRCQALLPRRTSHFTLHPLLSLHLLDNDQKKKQIMQLITPNTNVTKKRGSGGSNSKQTAMGRDTPGSEQSTPKFYERGHRPSHGSRLWRLLFSNLNRAIDELYVTCEEEEVIVVYTHR